MPTRDEKLELERKHQIGQFDLGGSSVYLLAAGQKGRSRHFACARAAVAEPGTGLLQCARSL